MVNTKKPRIRGKVADHIIRNIGYSHSHRTEAAGFSGGIWMLWNDNVEVFVLANNLQYVHAKVMKNNSLAFVVTAVYASPNPARRNVLWDYL